MVRTAAVNALPSPNRRLFVDCKQVLPAGIERDAYKVLKSASALQAWQVFIPPSMLP
jgi:hypothetical protein